MYRGKKCIGIRLYRPIGQGNGSLFFTIFLISKPTLLIFSSYNTIHMNKKQIEWLAHHDHVYDITSTFAIYGMIDWRNSKIFIKIQVIEDYSVWIKCSQFYYFQIKKYGNYRDYLHSIHTSTTDSFRQTHKLIDSSFVWRWCLIKRRLWCEQSKW